MPRCASCESEQPDHQRFCGACGASLTRSEHDATRTSAGDASSPAHLALESEGRSRFLPGFIFGHRFRIVGLLGCGGMGEVYRAEDLKLGQPVALKLLPPEMSADAARLTRFLNEARVALRVTHPNVCRVHDVVESAGLRFLVMEYVEGEDLASLLRRLGALPHDTALSQKPGWQKPLLSPAQIQH